MKSDLVEYKFNFLNSMIITRELFVIRHAKSDWSSGSAVDRDRPLNKRGRKDAIKIAEWMREQYLYPGWIYCSVATRARETLDALINVLDLNPEKIYYRDKLYLAELSVLLKFLQDIPNEQTSVMLIGHNPGLDDLVKYVSKDQIPLSDNGKLMTTACLARFKMPEDWMRIQGQGELMKIVRPADLGGN